MPVMENLIKKVVEEILKKSAGKAWKRATRNDRVLKVLGAMGLETGAPDPNFESVYAHTLIEYGIDKKQPVLNFFRHSQGISGGF